MLMLMSLVDDSLIMLSCFIYLLFVCSGWNVCEVCVSQGGPQSILIRRQKSGLRHTEKEEGHVRMQVEAAGMCL